MRGVGAEAQRFAPVSLTQVGAVWGPGLLVMLADTDAGNVVAAAQAGALWGFRLAPLLILLIPALFLLQDLALRLGIASPRGLGGLIREHGGWIGGSVAGFSLALATLSSLITEFSGVAGVGELYGVSRFASVALAALALLGVALTGEYRRAERIALALGIFEAAFLFVAWRSHPPLGEILRQSVDAPLRDPSFLYLAAGLIGATFNPWMAFYQASAVAERRLKGADYGAARADTLVGAFVTQGLTVAILVAVAAAVGHGASIATIGDISEALTPVLGEATGRFVFGLGVVGASMAAAVVATLACIWGLSEIFGTRASIRRRPGFLAAFAAVIALAAAIVLSVGDLVRLSVAMQVVNAALLPVLAVLVLLAGARALPAGLALSSRRFWTLALVLALVSAAGWVGAAAGWL